MKDVRRRWRGLKAFGLAAFATACLTCAPLTAKAGLIGGVGGGSASVDEPTEWCVGDNRPISYWGYDGWNGTQNEQMSGPLTRYSVECNAGGTAHRDFLVGLNSIDKSASRTDPSGVTSRPAGTYYLYKDGLMQTGLVRFEDGNLRYFDPETGAMVTNQWHKDYEAVWYYFGADGTAVSGWQSIGGDKYYFYPESHDMAYGRVQIDGKNYFLNSPGANADGRMQHSGWFYDSIYGKWSYATSSGELLTGWHNLGGAWYYFNESGVMLTGWINDSGTWYYANASGVMATGWLNIGGAWYYLDGSGAMVANGWRSLGGSWYWFGDSGAMATGWFLAGGSWYYASGSGAMATGWLSNGGTWYWLSGSGAMASNSWVNIGGVWYWFDNAGAMVTGWLEINGAWYYFSGSGAMTHDAWVGDYYLKSSGAMATNAWVGSYYVGEDGKWIPGYGLVWYKNGSDVYHTHKCRTVGKDAKGYSHISIQEAQRRGASRECKNCQQIG